MKRIWLFCLLFFSVLLNAQEKNFGIYSNLSSEAGEFGGFEIFFVPNKLLFQIAEGWPKDPVLLDIVHEKGNIYSTVHPEIGPILLTFAESNVELNFVNMKHVVTLKKGNSFWQQ